MFLGTASLGFVVLPIIGSISGVFYIDTEANAAYSLVTLKAVADLEKSQRFYDRVMAVLGFRKVARPLAGADLHVHYFNRAFQFTLRPSRGAREHDSYSPGLHHFCMRVADPASVDAAFRELRRRGIEASEPRFYPEYRDDYYALFLEDPDGIRLEVVNTLGIRRTTLEQWETIPPIEEGAS